jgi:hypothetical protein
MSRDEALVAALAMWPDRPGVARLCQELLSEYLDEPITAVAPDQVSFPHMPWLIGRWNRGNPYGRTGKP